MGGKYENEFEGYGLWSWEMMDIAQVMDQWQAKCKGSLKAS